MTNAGGSVRRARAVVVAVDDGGGVCGGGGPVVLRRLRRRPINGCGDGFGSFGGAAAAAVVVVKSIAIDLMVQRVPAGPPVLRVAGKPRPCASASASERTAARVRAIYLSSSSSSSEWWRWMRGARSQNLAALNGRFRTDTDKENPTV